MDSRQRSLPEKQIVVELDRRGNKLSRRYRVADEAPWEGPACGDVRKLSVPRRDDKSPVDLALLRRVIASGAEGERTAHLTGDGLDAAGELLFRVLFGTLDDWEDVALRLHRDRRLRPHRTPVRVRIHTEDGELLGLPWRITTYEQRLLLGERWTFELTHQTVDGEDLLFAPPGRILVIAPRALNGPGEDELLTESHVAGLRGIVDRVRPGHREKTDTFQEVSTWRDLDAALSTRPEIVYFYGHGRANGGQVYLRFGAGEGEVSIRDFIARLRPAGPKVVFLNACSLGQGGCGSVGHQLGATVPLVVSHLTPARADVARELAVDWFTEVLRHGSDPIAATHRQAGSGSSLAGGPASLSRFDHFGSLTVFGHYRTWRVHGRMPVDWEPLRRAFDLDRSAQREAFARRVEELCRRQDVHCHALVAYGAPGNVLNALGEQLSKDAEKHQEGRIDVNHVPLRNGHAEGWDPATLHKLLLDRAVERGLPKQETDMRKVLGQLAPEPLGPSARVVLLDLGVVRDSTSREKDLIRALEFLRDRVARPAPGERSVRPFHVVGLVAVELPAHETEGFAEFVDTLTGNAWEKGYFEHSPLPELGRAKRRDVRQFLLAHGRENDILDDLLDLLLARAGDGKTAEYETLVAELTYGLEHGWPALLAWLRSWKAGR